MKGIRTKMPFIAFFSETIPVPPQFFLFHRSGSMFSIWDALLFCIFVKQDGSLVPSSFVYIMTITNIQRTLVVYFK